MKVIIAFTIPLTGYTPDPKIWGENINFGYEMWSDIYFQTWLRERINNTHSSASDIIQNDLKYQIEKHTMGIHRESKNLHAHITYVCQVNNGKHYKILNDKIKRSKFNKLPEKTNITFKYDNEEKYDEFKALAYNLKEYSHYNDMSSDYTKYHEEITAEVKQELEELRKHGNNQFCIAKKHKEEKEKDNNEKKDLKKNMYSYIDHRIDLDQKQFTQELDIGAISQEVRWIAYHILKFYKDNNKSFSIAHLKNQALNYLYNKDYITEEQILSYANI